MADARPHQANAATAVSVITAVRDVTDFCVCPLCSANLRLVDDGLSCTACRTRFAVRNGIPILLPENTDELRERYVNAYEQVARDDLEEPFEHNRAARHKTLLAFIGDTRGQRVLDIGSSNAEYLLELDADKKVALDLALPFLEAIPPESDVVPVCSDAELLPVRPGYFDTVILSDVIEHLLEPERLMERLKAVCRPDTRLIVHVPWKEDLGKYAGSKYEFTHLRRFDEYSFHQLWRYFTIHRERSTYPMLEDPIVFHLKRFLPLRAYDRLARWYFHGSLSRREYEWRARWIAELPKRERWLLRFYPPAFRIFELRVRPEFAASAAVRDSPLKRRLRLPRLR
jgi:SAM-dependent methyltransferase